MYDCNREKVFSKRFIFRIISSVQIFYYFLFFGTYNNNLFLICVTFLLIT